MGAGHKAWITSARNDVEAAKAELVGLSLRRVETTKALVVIVSPSVSSSLRKSLSNVFDMVYISEPDNGKLLFPNAGQNDWAVATAFSLKIFEACVYLSPNTIVVENADEIFEIKCSLSASLTKAKTVDTSVLYFKTGFDFTQNFGTAMDLSVLTEWAFATKAKEVVFQPLDPEYNITSDSALLEDIILLGRKMRILNFGETSSGASPSNGNATSVPSLAHTFLGKVRSAVLNELESFRQEIYMNGRLLRSSSPQSEPIAIIGLSFRLPDANNVEEFTDLLLTGKEGIKPLPSFRWTKKHSYYPCEMRNVEGGFLNFPIDEFDAKFFGISPMDAEYLDPQQRLLHEVSWEALEDAMIDPLSLKGTQTSFFVGSWMHDYQTIATNQADSDFFRVYMGNSIGASAARLSHFYETMGPSVATESGCSASIVAVDMAVKSLRNRETDLALACGVNLFLHPFDKSKFSFVISPNGRCKTFDAGADGFGRAEGCAVLVLKRLPEAIKDGNNIWGVIRGSAIRQEGMSKSMGTPTVQCESLVMELALKDAGVEPKDVSYVEAHGTGTPVGDPLEIAAITRAYSKGRSDPLIIGSVKTNIGHTESVSGITGIIKVLLSIKASIIPKHLNLKTLNPEINLSPIPAKIPIDPIPWPKTNERKRIAGVSSFGISGTDGHVIVEEPPTLPKALNSLRLTAQSDRPLHILKISTKSSESLSKKLKNYKELLTRKANEIENGESNGDSFADVAFSANTGRSTFNHRAVIIASSFSDAAKIIEEEKVKQAVCFPSAGNKLCFLFTGQGSQYPNMASTLYKTSPVFKHYFDKCDEYLRENYSISLQKVLWENPEEVNRTIYSQTSIFVVEYCLVKLWESWGIKPDFVLGHSLGEFAAAVAAGILKFSDAIKLVAERSRLIDSLPQGKMLVIKADKKTVDEAIKAYQQNNKGFWADYAALNSVDQTALAGDSFHMQEFAKFCKERGFKNVMLASTHAFHSRHMEPMLEEYGKVCSSVEHLKPDTSAPIFISAVEGKIVEPSSINADYWIRHTRERVNFIDTCKVLKAEQCNLFLEVGPHPILSALTMMNIDSPVTCLPSLRKKEEEWNTLLDSLSKLYLSDWKGAIDWKGFDKVYDRKRVPVPFYQFNKKSVWTKFLKLYPKIHPLLGSILPNAASETMYESILTLKNTEFIKDHVIGDTVIFPGAAFLEMCLVGGHAAVQGSTEQLFKPRRPVSLKNFKIFSPLALRDSETCSLQTIIKLGDDTDETEIGYHVGVHHYHMEAEDGEGSEEWLQKASATYSSSVAELPPEVAEAESIDLHEIQTSWTRFDDNIKRFYDMLTGVGLKFGPRFQSIESGWVNDSSILTKLKVPEEGGHDGFMTHPIITDAMFQTIMVSKYGLDEKKRRKLFVPITVQEFIWLGEIDSTSLYLFASRNGEKEIFCVLMNEKSIPLAYMKEPEFMETTVKLVEQVVQKQGNKLPGMWKEQWKSYPSPLEQRAELHAIPQDVSWTEEELRLFMEANCVDEGEAQVYTNLLKLTKFYFASTLMKLGWRPQVSNVIRVEDLLTNLQIKLNFFQYVLFFCNEFLKEGLLGRCGEDRCHHEFVVCKDFPNLSDEISRLERCLDSSRGDVGLIIEIGHNLPDILLGERDPLTVLFPERKTESNAGASAYYRSLALSAEKVKFFISNLLICRLGGRNKADFEAPNSDVIRVLEVGGGTGTWTYVMLDEFKKLGIRYEYVFTDISSAFFNAAKENLGKQEGIIFKKFDMEKDPLQQDFSPHYFDIIMAAEVLHVGSSATKILENLRMVLKPRGSLLAFEHIVQDPRTSFAFGCLNGFWESKGERPHPYMSGESWKECLHSTGFETVLIAPYYNNVHGIIFAQASSSTVFSGTGREEENSWLIFDNDENESVSRALQVKLRNVNRHVVNFKRPCIPEDKGDMETLMKATIESKIQACTENGRKLEGILYLWTLPNEDNLMRNQSSISLPLISLCQSICEMENYKPRIYVVTQGLANFDPLEVTDPNPGTVIGIIRCIYNELPTLRITNLDIGLDGSGPRPEEIIFANIWTDFRLPRVAFRGQCSYVPKLVAAKCENLQRLDLPSGCDRFQLELPKSRLISDLEYTYLEPYSLAENEAEVEVKAVGLNFRDVFAVLKPITFFEDVNAVGFEFSGVISKVGKNVKKRKIGDRVIGINLKQNVSMPSHFKLTENMVVSLPEGMTFAEGATLATGFCTAHFCLCKATTLKDGETVLIHTASGAVGLCAIQLAQGVGANIIATAGSPRKRNFLMGLGIQHVFNSRTTEFGKRVLEVTKGKGVDVVLNTLTGEGFKEASLASLGKGGRFIEISKLNVWTPEEVKELRLDVDYQFVDLTALDDSVIAKEFEALQQYFRGAIKPLPLETFEALNIRGALNYMQKAKHIGKVICIMPKVTLDNLKFRATTPIFNPYSTYVVTGGLGGIGFEVVNWMLKNGAKHIAIISRRKPNSTCGSQIDHWNKTGSHVRVFNFDIGDLEQCQELFRTLSSSHSGFPTVRGVMHAAGVLRDGLLENQTWSRFQETYNPKVNGTWNLHLMTKDLVLEHFVLFSSIAATFGSAGQGNHCASNSFEDMFATYRRSIGLPATSINWGNWGEVGVATEIDIPGFRPISTFHGLSALQALLMTQGSHVAVMNVDSFAKAAVSFPAFKLAIDDLALPGEVKTCCIINSDEFWQEVDEAEAEEVSEVFTNYIKMILRNALKMGSEENIDSHTDFQSLGVDSLMMLELKNSLQNLFGSRLSLSTGEIKDCSNTAELASKLIRNLKNGNNEATVLPTPEEAKTLIRTDANLILKFSDEKPPAPAKEITEVETVMISIASGTIALYLLRNLSRLPQIKRIYCLLRPSKKKTSLEILNERLASISIRDEVDMSKVKCIEGDITSKKLNLSSELFNRLTEEVDAVFHYWTKVDFIAKYWNAPESMKQDIRTVNVVGTSNLLEFVVTNKTKHLLFPSTVLCVTEVGTDGNLLEDWQDIGAMDNYTQYAGFLLTKHICEQMIKKASDLYNIPCKVIRHPYIAGDSKTGRTTIQNNHQVLRWLVYMRLGCMPYVPTPFAAVPVDKGAELSLDIFFNPKAPSGVYHLMPQLMEMEQEIIRVAQEEFGVHIETVETSEFLERLNAEGEDSPISSYIKLYAEDVSVVLTPEFSAVESYKNYLERSGNLNKVKLADLEPKYNDGYLESLGVVMRRELKYLKDMGIFEEFGIEVKN